MLPKKIEREPENDNYRALAFYVADATIGTTKGEKTFHSWYSGGSTENYLEGMIEVEATQAMNTRTDQEKTYHLMVSFRPEDESKLTTEIFQEIELELAKALGFENHQRHCGVHKNTDNMHMHIAYNMIHPEKFTRHAPYFDYAKLHKTCRVLEQKYGLEVDPGMDKNDSKKETKTNVKAQTVEAHTGQESLYTYVSNLKPFIMDSLEKSSNWVDFHAAFLRHGLVLKLSGNGLAIKDRFGKHHVTPSKIDRSLSKGMLEKKLGAFSEASPALMNDIKAEKCYNAAPLHVNPDRDNLYAIFSQKQQERRAKLEALNSQEKNVIQADNKRWSEKRKEISKYPMMLKEKQRLLHEIKIRQEAEKHKIRNAFSQKKQLIRDEIPYTSWTKFLQHSASQGNETALAVLRSKKGQIQEEKDSNAYLNQQQKRAEIRAESLEKQSQILSIHGVSGKNRRALLAVAKMEELLKYERNNGENKSDFLPISYRIDTKGTVIFTLKSGGTIRDTGRELHFSQHDPNATNLATQFAQLKWGKRFEMSKNMIKYKNDYMLRNEKAVSR